MPRISQLPSLTAADNTDEIAIVDVSASTTKKITRGDLLKAPLPANSVTTAAIPDGAVTAAKMQYGMVRNRQGGTTGDATWITGGSGNTNTSSKAVFIQVGSVTGATGTVTFPTAYTYPPLVFVSVMTAGTQNVWARAKDVTATNFAWQIFISTSATGTSETVSWLAIGQ